MLPRRILGVDIRLGRCTTTVRHPIVDRALRVPQGWLTANQRTARLTVDGVGIFCIDEGRSVVAELLGGADPSEIREWIYGPVAAILVSQQGRVPLHATSVDLDGSVVAIAGGPGAGKSTAGLTLQQRGHGLVSDDLSPIEMERAPGRPTTFSVVPFDRPVHVSPETAAAIGLRVPEPHDPVTRSGKLALPPVDASPGELRGVVVLEWDQSPSVHAIRVSTVQAVPLLTAHVHGVHIVPQIWAEQVFSWAAALAEMIPIYRVARPVNGWTIEETANEIVRIATGVATGVPD